MSNMTKEPTILPGNVSGPHPMTKAPSLTTEQLKAITTRLLISTMTATTPTPLRPLYNKQIILLATAEESYSQAATVLQPVLKDLIKLWDMGGPGVDQDVERVRTGLHLLEEAMGAHNRYMESLK